MLPLGFHFYPSDVELLTYYLKSKVLGKKFPFDTIADLDIYKHAPWDFPEKSLLNTGDLKKWFFFCPIKKYAKGAQLNRATVYGYWKTTGKDRPVIYNKEGVVQDTFVLCVVFKKDSMGLGNSAQCGAQFKEEDWSDNEDDNLVGTGPISILSRLALRGANGSHVPESLCAEPSIGSRGLYTVIQTIVIGNSLPLEGGSDTNAALTFMDAPNVVVVDDKDVHALMDALHLAHVQESNPSISSLLGIFTEDDAAFITYIDGQMTGNANDFTFKVTQVSEDDNISLMLAFFIEDDAASIEVPQVSGDDDISLMLASFIEEEDWNNV
ncbi:No apical meristem (NAM) protein [Corchorus olitorius]|uniref:No apical meristem (NAM) protein n=1 Tax=Corchorus olitorius TaxID=93759 RepID=A0A1R3JLY0_9ROSI|nr:No apical meristem (NAM) protein [Corchorus olitorius]